MLSTRFHDIVVPFGGGCTTAMTLRSAASHAKTFCAFLHAPIRLCDGVTAAIETFEFLPYAPLCETVGETLFSAESKGHENKISILHIFLSVTSIKILRSVVDFCLGQFRQAGVEFQCCKRVPTDTQVLRCHMTINKRLAAPIPSHSPENTERTPSNDTRLLCTQNNKLTCTVFPEKPFPRKPKKSAGCILVVLESFCKLCCTMRHLKTIFNRIRNFNTSHVEAFFFFGCMHSKEIRENHV